MHVDLPILDARLVKRYKRFLADVVLPDGREITVHCPNTGAMLGCTPEGAPVLLRDSQNPARKLRYTLHAVEVGGTWVCVDPALSNRLVAEAVEAGTVPGLAGYAGLRREVRYGEKSRIDLLLEAEGRPPCYVEVKSTTLATDRCAAFPDAVTARGQKHLRELVGVVERGERAVLFFCVSRDDVDTFRPADEIDPEYGRLLRAAVEGGVEALAWTTRIARDSMELSRPIPVQLGCGTEARQG